MALPPYHRAAHQPAQQPPARKKLSPEQLAQICGHTTCLILAHRTGTAPLRVEFDDPELPAVICGEDGTTPRPLQEFEGRPCVQIAVQTARSAHLASVAVLAPEQEAARQQVEKAVRAADAASIRKEHSTCGADGNVSSSAPASPSTHPTRIMTWDARRNRMLTRRADNLDLLSLPAGVLECAYDTLSQHAEADSVLILSCDQVRITSEHLAEICTAFRDDPSLAVVSSWIAWLDRTPLLISRHYLERLHLVFEGASVCDDTPDAPTTANAHRFLPPDFASQQVVFGEEKLAANDPSTPAVERFLKDCTLSAREAVALARAAREQDAAKSDHADTANGAERKPQEEEQRSDADEALIETARRILDQMSEALTLEEEHDVARADAWGRRNRNDFPLLNDRQHAHTLAYLDSAATTQRCFRALQAQRTFDEHENANVYRGSYDLSMQATLSLNAARKTLENFIGADRRQTVYTSNASASCALVAQAWGERNIAAGDLLVVPLSEHHSNLVPWLMLAQRKQAEVAFVPLLPDGRLDESVFEKLLRRRPKLVAVAHIGNVMGLRNPVERMVSHAHEAGARVYVDAAQSLAHVPLNVKELGADFVGFSAHKMYGPLGIGGLWISPDAFDEMDPLVAGGGTISHVSLSSYYLRAGAIQYELGTPPISQAIGWAAAIDYLRDLGMENVMEHAASLTVYLRKGLSCIEGASVWGNHEPDFADGQMGLVAFSLAGIPPASVGAFCGKLGVAVRSGGHCSLPLASRMGVLGTIRASFAVHTTREDVEALLTAVALCYQLHANPDAAAADAGSESEDHA